MQTIRRESSITVGAYFSRWLCHWLGVAWCADGRGEIFDWGRLAPAPEGPPEIGFELAVAELGRICRTGWTDEAGLRLPSQVWTDSGSAVDAEHLQDWALSARERLSLGTIVAPRGDRALEQHLSGTGRTKPWLRALGLALAAANAERGGPSHA